MAKIYQYKKSLPQNPFSCGFSSPIHEAGDGKNTSPTDSHDLTSPAGSHDFSSHDFSSPHFSTSDYEAEVEQKKAGGRWDYSGLGYTGSMRVSLCRDLQLIVHFIYGSL